MTDKLSERRYFYTDPLAAAWMVKHLGMRFIGGISFDDDTQWIRWKNKLVGGERFYVHPDSLPLLVPQVGDIVAPSTDAGCGVVDVKDGFLGMAQHLMALSKYHVIRRNGKAFHWPESEEA